MRLFIDTHTEEVETDSATFGLIIESTSGPVTPDQRKPFGTRDGVEYWRKPLTFAQADEYLAIVNDAEALAEALDAGYVTLTGGKRGKPAAPRRSLASRLATVEADAPTTGKAGK